MPPTKEEEKQGNKVQEDTINEESGKEDEASPKKQESKEKKKSSKKKKRSRKQGDALDLVRGSDPGDAVSSTVGGAVSGQQQGGGNQQSDHPLSLRLDLNLDVEITLKARVHGDVTLALLA
ncbi:hypothetical protein G6F36_014773 [Rhizopus arrhizus]|nr:hypothetical protein G6F36_014773 [Rhizopus arrhizus]